MKHYLLIFIAACNTYTGVVVKKGRNRSDLEVKISDYHYVLPLVTLDEYDSLSIGDTLVIDKATLRIVK